MRRFHLKTELIKPNNIVLQLIFLEIIVYLFEYEKSILRKITFKEYIGKFKNWYLYVAGFIILVIYALYQVCRIYEINFFLGLILLFMSTLLILNYRLKYHKKMTTRTISYEESLKKVKTGDLVVWETDYTLDNTLYLIPILMTGMYHIGLIMKEPDGDIYILECSNSKSLCKYTGREKKGIRLSDYNERTYISTNGSFFLIQTNLIEKITNNDIKQFFEIHKNKDYMEDNYNCISIYLHFLQDNNLLKTNYTIFPSHEDLATLIDPKFYSYDFKSETIKVKKYQ